MAEGTPVLPHVMAPVLEDKDKEGKFVWTITHRHQGTFVWYSLSDDKDVVIEEYKTYNGIVEDNGTIKVKQGAPEAPVVKAKPKAKPKKNPVADSLVDEAEEVV